MCHKRDLICNISPYPLPHTSQSIQTMDSSAIVNSVDVDATNEMDALVACIDSTKEQDLSNFMMYCQQKKLKVETNNFGELFEAYCGHVYTNTVKGNVPECFKFSNPTIPRGYLKKCIRYLRSSPIVKILKIAEQSEPITDMIKEIILPSGVTSGALEYLEVKSRSDDESIEVPYLKEVADMLREKHPWEKEWKKQKYHMKISIRTAHVKFLFSYGPNNNDMNHKYAKVCYLRVTFKPNIVDSISRQVWMDIMRDCLEYNDWSYSFTNDKLDFIECPYMHTEVGRKAVADAYEFTKQARKYYYNKKVLEPEPTKKEEVQEMNAPPTQEEVQEMNAPPTQGEFVYENEEETSSNPMKRRREHSDE